MRIRFHDNLSRAVTGLALAATWLLGGTVAAHAQVPLFDGLDWVMDRGANSFAPVSGMINTPPVAGTAPAGIPLRQGHNNFNARVNDAAGNPDAASLLNNDPWRGVRRSVWPRTADLTITGLLETEIIDNPNLNDPDNDTDTAGNSVRVQPRSPLAVGNVPIDMAHAFLFGAWTGPLNIVPGAVGPPPDYRSPVGGFSFTTDLSQVYADDYAFTTAVHNDFLVDRTGGKLTPVTQGELAGLPYVAPEVYAALENVLKTTNTATSVWELGAFSNAAARFTIDIYSPGNGTFTGVPGDGLVARPNVTRAIVRVSYGHIPTATDLNNVQTVDANGQPIKAGVEDSRYSRLFLVDLSQAGWINIAPGGGSPSAFDYSGDPRYQTVVTLYTVTPDDVNDKTLFASRPLVTADAIRFNPQPMPSNSPGLTQTVDGTAATPTLYSIAPTGRILGPVVGTNKFANPPFLSPPGGPFDITANDTEPLIYLAREEAVPDTTPIIPFDPTKPVSTTPPANPLVIDPTLATTAPVFYCIDNKNSNATKGPVAMPVETVTVDRVRWRYVGVPDGVSGSGTVSASPLLANVRCRDGIVRPILYYVTTNATGGVGHIYALDPIGNRVTTTATGQQFNNTTTAYWIYPSYRPLTTAELGAGLVPPQYHDPNYNGSVKYSTGIAPIDALPARDNNGTLPAPPWGADEGNLPEKYYVDGDIVQNSAAAGHLVVRSDTQISFPGIQSSPMVIDDPDNTVGAQILIVGGMNGRVYCLDAGGRGDFIYDPTHQNDAVNPAAGIPYSVAGTSQRYWTWPHFAADAFHAKYGPGTSGAGLGTKNTIVDEPNKIAFPSSPAFEAINVVAANPFFIGGADGHMFALFAKHDKFNGLDSRQNPLYDERRSWVYPNLPSSKGDTQTLDAAPSTPAIFTPTGSANPLLYFTCAGRVYCINAHPPLGSTPTMIPNTAARWVFPFTNNPPFPNPADSFSAPIDAGFSGTAPLLLSQAEINSALPNPNPVTRDYCYVVAGDGTVYAIDAFTNGGPTAAQVATGQSFSAGTTRCSPIASRLTGALGLTTDTTDEVPTVVFADDDGAIWGVSARPDAGTPEGVIPGTALLPVLWGHFDSTNSRLAAASLVNGMIYEGGEDGQLRAYGVGTGANGLGTTLDRGERAESGFGENLAGISIDLRGLNLYTAADYALMTKQPPQKTPALQHDGTAYANSAAPITGTIDPNNGSVDKTTWPAVVDWGDGLYIAAYGVYRGQLQNVAGTHGVAGAAGTPKVQVLMTISQPGMPSISLRLDAVPVTNWPGVTDNTLWPDDRGITAGEHTGVSIYAIDDASLTRNPNSNLNGDQLFGRDHGVFPFAVYYKLPIIPDASKPFTPGTSGYRITARAVITQTIQDVTPNDAPMQYSQSSNFLQLGQRDYAGLVPVNGYGSVASPTNLVIPDNPNQVAKLGRRRDVLITNPLAVTVRSYVNQGGATEQRPLGSTIQPAPARDNTGPANPNIIGMGPSGSVLTAPGIYEVLGNGNRILNPYATVNAGTSPIKALFAPLAMIPHGSTATYGAVTDAGQKVAAFYIADRTNLANRGPGGSGGHLRVRVLTRSLHWLGSNSSVMNPLPWDLMPNDAQDTRDYPNLPLGALSIAAAASGQDAVNGPVQLTQPIYDNNNNPDTRTVVPTEFRMTARVPKFQPANVNRGVKNWQLADGTAFTFGSPFTDIGGNVAGNGAGTPDVIGPLLATSGQPVPVKSGLAFPAGGYVGEIVIEAVPNGAATGVARFNPQAIFNASRGDSGSTIAQAYRSVEIGTSVPPSVKMRVVEQTIDLGKRPHGTGYSDLTGVPDFRFPFSPSNPIDWTVAPWNGNSPWDSDQLLGQFFRPLTLVNESNVNLYDVRVGKIMADAPITLNSLTPLALTSDQTSATIIAPPYLGPANRRAAGIGIVSSFDHISKASQNFGAVFPERPLWPMQNPYVDQNGIDGATPSGLQTKDALAVGLRGWFPGIQPQPTVHKPRVGDTTGSIATIPDTPYDGVNPDFKPQQPKVSLAIPLGTPVGTYSAPVYPYEDNVPLQWQEWLQASGGFGVNSGGQFVDTSHDGAINAVRDPATGARTPIEPYADPTFILKTTVREARLTGGVTVGTLPEIDTFSQGLLSPNPLDNKNNVNPDVLNPPFGFNMLPAAMFQPTGPGNYQIDLYWSTPRQPNNSPYISTAGLKTGYPVADAPWSLAYSALFEGIGGWTFGNPGTNKFANATWWSVGNNSTFGLFPGYNGAGQPNNLADLFPSTPTEASVLNVPYTPGTRVPRTVRYASPAAAVRTFAGVPSNYPTAAQVGYLFWQGVLDKQRGNGAANSSSQFTESRTFYAPVPTGSNGAPDPTRIQSLLNDPALPKLSPKPLLLSTGANQDIMYLFWHAGSGAQTQLYYNGNTSAGFPSAAWSRDTRLETPEALAWQSDPTPLYHQSWDTVNNKAMDVIDVVYTGVLKNRRTVETMLSRYKIDPANFSLSITGLPEVVGEQMSRTGNTFSYSARDAAWAYGTGPQGQLLPTDKESRIKLYISKNYGPITPLVPASAGFTTDATGDHFPIGKYDPASGLIYYTSSLGGQLVVDPRSGTVSFPQVAPGRNDAIYVSYVPMVMRLNTSRDETNLIRTAGYGAFSANDPAFVQRTATVSPGSNQNPVAVLERDFNERALLTSPQVVFPKNTGAAFPRLWVLYRKSDVSGTVKSTIYYKAMRLMARLPRPVALTNTNGTYAITNMNINGNVGPFEVDWVRGRVYFTELDEGRTVTISYTYINNIGQPVSSGNLAYRIAWGDEISATSLPSDPTAPFVDHTTPEVVLPTDSSVNEGQVTAFQIPANLRTGPAVSGQPFQPTQGSELWVFWTSTRAGTTDLYYETIRPNFYPNATNQR